MVLREGFARERVMLLNLLEKVFNSNNERVHTRILVCLLEYLREARIYIINAIYYTI